MKKLLFLLLFPCLCVAQYTGNAGQKITLGEQTTADGLVYRGVASIDTVTATSKITRANKQDTSAFILLDTVTNLLWHYKIGSNGWIQAGGSTLDTATMLLPYYRAGRNGIIQAANVPTLNQNTTGSAATLTTGRTIQTNLASTSAATFNGSANITPGVTGTLPVANGGTNASTFTAGSVVFAGASGTYTQDNANLFWNDSNNKLGIGTASPLSSLNIQDGSLYIGSSSNISQTQNILFSYGYNFNGTPLGVSKITSTYNNNNSSASLEFYTSPPNINPIERILISSTGEIGLGMSTPTAVVQIKAGTTSSNTAPLKFTSGSLTNNAEAGAMEFNGTNLFFSPSSTRHTVNHGLIGSATLDFLSTNAQNSRDMTIAVDGAADGDVVSLGVPNAAVKANTSYSAWVSAANTVTVRFNNYSNASVDPDEGLFKVFVTK